MRIRLVVLLLSSLSFALSISKLITCEYFAVPTLMVTMQPEAGAALNIPPYNSFTLRCAATAPDGVVLEKTFEWINNGNVIMDNGNTVLLSYRDTNMPQSISELTVNDLMIGNHTYFCSASMLVPGGVNIVAHATGTIHVKGKNSQNTILHSNIKILCTGQSSPVQPSIIRTVNVTADSATVQWVVPYLAYTQEQYSVSYGTARDSLDQSSPILSSTADISASNVTYNVSIQDLIPNTAYYFQLLSRNTFGMTTSATMTFTTMEAGNYISI